MEGSTCADTAVAAASAATTATHPRAILAQLPVCLPACLPVATATRGGVMGGRDIKRRRQCE